MNDKLVTHVEMARKLLVELTDGEFSEHEALANRFMDSFFKVSLALGLHPELAEAEPVRSFLQEVTSRLFPLKLVMSMYVMRTSNLLSSNWEDEEWKYACERRSSIEFLRNLFSIPDTDELLDTRTVDDMMRQRGETEGGLPESAINPGIPSSHWWWWYPNQVLDRKFP